MSSTVQIVTFVVQISESLVGGVLKVDERASAYGRALQGGTRAERSAAAAKLRKYGGSAIDNVLDNGLVRGVARGAKGALLGVGLALEFWSFTREGDSVPEAMVKTGVSGITVGGAAYAGGLMGCAFTPVGCAVGAGVGAVVGVFVSEPVTNFIDKIWPW